MDFRGYGKGAIVLVGLGALGIVANQFEPKSAPNPAAEAPLADPAPGCVAQGADPAPPTFASAPDPDGIADRYVFDRLVEYDRRSGRLVSGLATSWKVSDDGREYAFRLRTGVLFHAAPGFAPSRPFTAEDVLFSFARMMVPRHPFHDIPESGNADFATVGMNDLLAEVSKDGEATIVFRLVQPHPKFLANLSMDFASIRSAEYAAAMQKAGTPERFAAWPVGTGPFAVADTGKDGVRYTANPHYWGNALSGAAPQPVERQVVVPIPNAGID
jgi:dipeptide transport system substrate-binding protein